MLEKSFIPDGLEDIFILLTVLAVVWQMFKVFQPIRVLSNIMASEERKMFFRVLPLTLGITLIVYMLATPIIWGLNAMLTAISAAGAKEATITFGILFSGLVGLVLGGLVNLAKESRIPMPVSAYLAFGLSILLLACLFGLAVWPETKVSSITTIEQLWPMAAVTLVGIVGYLISSKPWEPFKS